MKIEERVFMEDSEASINLYLHEPISEEEELKPMILVIPGGGYEILAPHEGEPIALQFYMQGYHAAVLSYTVAQKPLGYRPMIEGYHAIKLIREHAREFRVNPEQIVVCGFSAGAHLAASLGVMWKKKEIQDKMRCSDIRYQPNAMILCYPVISSGPAAHRGSFAMLTGSMEDDEVNEMFSIDQLVDSYTPPVFIWHTADDEVVPIENTLLLEQSLAVHKISFEAHIFRSGRHGLGLCDGQWWDNEEPHCRHWVEQCEEWLKTIFAMK